MPLKPRIYGILNQGEGSVKLLPISDEGKIYVWSGELVISC